MQIYSDQIDKFKLRIIDSRDDHEGTPLLIFNGIGASIELLEPLVREMSIPVVAFDMPGTGGSPLGYVGLGMSNYARIGSALINKMDIATVNVMGVSWGGGVAQQFVRLNEARSQKLILAATSMGQVMVPPRLDVLLHMASPLRYMNASYFQQIAPTIYGGDFRSNAALSEDHAAHMKPPNPLGYLQQLAAMTGWTSAFWLHQLRHETLVLAGEDDPIIPLANARIMARQLPNATLESFDCGHLFMLTRKQETVDSIERFLLY